MKSEIKTPVIVVVIIAVVTLLVFVGMKLNNTGGLDSGQVKYTPGKPPWEETDPSKKGPGGPPSGGPTAGGPGAGSELAGANAAPPPPGGAPVGAPVINNGK